MRIAALVFFVACMPQQTPVHASVAPAKPSGCREENADCAAACALRETSRSPQFIEWFDQRCAAAVLGKNPDVTVGANPPPLKAELLDTR